MHGLAIVRKWPVQPVSAMACTILDGVQLEECLTNGLVGVMLLVLLHIAEAAPRSHWMVLVLAVVLPPIVLLRVAVDWWPGAG